jgi:hypothetical protein
MSGGNHIILRHALALCLAAGLLAPAAAAEEPGFTTGIAAANIAWAKAPAIAETMTGIAEAGFGSVRIGFKNPIAGTFRALDAAKAEGLDVLVTVPLIDGAVAAKGAEPRPRNKHFFPAYGLSQIDLDRYEARMPRHGQPPSALPSKPESTNTPLSSNAPVLRCGRTRASTTSNWSQRALPISTQPSFTVSAPAISTPLWSMTPLPYAASLTTSMRSASTFTNPCATPPMSVTGRA